MPLPLFLGIGAAIAGATGIGASIKGGMKMKEAKTRMAEANRRNEENKERLSQTNSCTTNAMDELGKLELSIIESFSDFSDAIEKIQNRPEFSPIEVNGVALPTYSPDELKQVSVGAGILLGGLAGAGIGTAGGFAAAGATTAAVMALGTASTGTAIASLSGAAATNATLAALGGGAIAAGGGGVALGTTILGASTLGVGLLVGGIIFNITGSKLSSKADEAERQVQNIELEINRSCAFLQDLNNCATNYYSMIKQVERVYRRYLNRIEYVVYDEHNSDWNKYSNSEKKAVENCSYLVGLLYKMCKVQIVKKSEKKDGLNMICYEDIDNAKNNAIQLLDKIGIPISRTDAEPEDKSKIDRLAMAKKLKESNVPIETIAKCTGLTEEEVNAL